MSIRIKSKATNQQKQTNKSLNQTNAGTSSFYKTGETQLRCEKKNDATYKFVSQNTSQTQKKFGQITQII